MLEGGKGSDLLNGGLGTDTAVFGGARGSYTVDQLSNGNFQVSSKEGTDVDTLKSIEYLKFADGIMTSADALKVDVTPPSVPTLAVAKNANGYALGDSPKIIGGAEAFSSITLYDGTLAVLGKTQADANGLWSFQLGPLDDGLDYKVSATAADSWGNVSVASAVTRFNIDAHAPDAPTVEVLHEPDSNMAIFRGYGEAGTELKLVRVSDLADIDHTTVDTDGSWTISTGPLPNGEYAIAAVSLDGADNATSAEDQVTFTVNSKDNFNGTDQADTLAALAGNNAIDGRAGLDTVVFAGARANYTVSEQTLGYGVIDKVGDGGHDTLINVERLAFDDATIALDLDGTAGQAFRLYQAAFDRTPDLPGLGYWIYGMDRGLKLSDVAAAFQVLPEFESIYGKNVSDDVFLTHLYNNVLHRDPDAGGFEYWMNAMQNNGVTHTEILTLFSESPRTRPRSSAPSTTGSPTRPGMVEVRG